MGDKARFRGAGLRIMHEEYSVPLELIARTTGLTLKGLQDRARREGWEQAPAGASRQALQKRLDALRQDLVNRLEALAAAARKPKGRLDREKFDEINSILRVTEKVDATTRAKERAEEKTRTDEEMAAAYQRINERIVALARELAARLAATKSRKGRSVADRQ